jgi:acyl-CoA thioesterase
MDQQMKDKLFRYFNKKDIFCSRNGIELVDIADGYARVKMTISEGHYNSISTVHGGAIFALADLAFAAASNSHGTVAVGIHTDMSFVKAATGGVLFAEAKEMSINPKIATYSVTVTDEAGDNVALFHGMVYRKRDILQLED